MWLQSFFLGSLLSVVSAEDLQPGPESKEIVKDLYKLYSNLGDTKFNCPLDKSEDVSNLAQLFEVVDCDHKAARYDYSLKLNSGKKPKRKSAVNGQAVLRFSAHGGGAHELKDGLRLGRCYQVFDKNISSLSGRFKDDKLNGRVVLEFHNETMALAQAVDNVLVGTVRHFATGLHPNVGRGGMNNLFRITNVHGEILWSHHEGSTFHFRVSEKPSMSFFTDFKEVYACQTNDGVIMLDCGFVTSAKVLPESCDLQISNVVIESGNTMYNRKLNEAFDPDTQNPFDYCPQAESGAFNAEAIRTSVEAWLAALQAPDKDPFWMLTDPLKEPFSPEEGESPMLNLYIPHYKYRPGFDFKEYKVIGGKGTVLFTGKMRNGYLSGKVSDPTNPEWASPLRVFDQESSALESTTGLVATGLGTISGDAPIAMGRIRHGKFHGYVRMFGIVTNDPKALCSYQVLSKNQLAFIGKYENGRPSGYCWKGLFGGAWVVGTVDSEGDFTGDDIHYVYPDMLTAFAGKFENGLMIDGQEAEVIGERCVNGIKELKFSEAAGPVFHYDPPSNTSLGDQPQLGDPLDNRYIYLRDSETFPLAGEGAHARVEVPPNTIYGLYGGHVVTKSQMALLKETENKTFIDRGITDPHHPDVIASWKYRHTIGHCGLGIDIPAEYEPVEKFRGTLGHKVNHKFDPTTRYTQIDSARFGLINAVKTVQAIAKDEEYFASYGYPPTINLPWYREAYLKYAEENPTKANKALLENIVKAQESGGAVDSAWDGNMGMDVDVDDKKAEENLVQ